MRDELAGHAGARPVLVEVLAADTAHQLHLSLDRGVDVVAEVDELEPAGGRLRAPTTVDHELERWQLG